MSVTTLKAELWRKIQVMLWITLYVPLISYVVEIKYRRISCLSISSGCYHASNQPQ